MRSNVSPWIHQLDPERVPVRLTHDLETDVAIVGAGIAGIATAFFTLKNTDKNVVVLEGGKIAHGATGHNAGQVVSYFERGFASLVEEFGLELATAGQRDVEHAWELLDEMYREAGLDIPFSRFLGHAGLTSKEQVLLHLENNRLRREGGLSIERITIADHLPFLNEISEKYAGLYKRAPHKVVLDALETEVTDYIADLAYQKGVVNSALFCQEVVAYLTQAYPTRFALYEHAPVHKIILRDGQALLDAETNCVTAKRVVLCTNGFENFTLIDKHGLAIDTLFRHRLKGTVGYMSGYLEPMNKEPAAISYLEDPSADTSLSYFYLTRRPYDMHGDKIDNLISIGGPGFDIQDTREYRHDAEFPEDIVAEIDRFVKKTYDPDPNKEIKFEFTWHGLMGYTRNGVRIVGNEPGHEELLYNLGCNGIGILPSLHGGRHIARIIAGEHVAPSIFDVPQE